MRLNLEVKRPADMMLVLLLATTAFLVFLDVYHFFTGLLDDPFFDLEFDNGLAQSFRQIQEFWIVLMLLFTACRKWRFLCLSWALLFLVFLLDDSLALHEQFGLLLSERAGLPPLFGMRPQDLGELLVYGSWGISLTILILVAHVLSRYEARRFSAGLFGLLALLVLFGAGMDFMQGISHSVWIHAGFGKLEESGTMVVVSVMVWYVLRNCTDSRPDPV